MGPAASDVKLSTSDGVWLANINSPTQVGIYLAIYLVTYLLTCLPTSLLTE